MVSVAPNPGRSFAQCILECYHAYASISEYVGKLVQEAMASNEQCTSLDEAAIAKKRIFPAPMNAAFTRPSKRELVEAKRSRFGQVTP